MRKSNNDSGLTARRSYRRLIVGLTALAVSLALQAQDYLRLGERTIMGTARYVGMGGAMSAIGADPTASMDNPAGLGLYRRLEATLSLEYANGFMAPQASIVLNLPTGHVDGVLFHNFMFSYNRRHSFNRTLLGTAANSPSLGALLATTEVDLGIPYATDRYNETNTLQLSESGYVNEFAFDYALNISDQWYWGIGLRISSFYLSSSGDYIEYFPQKNAEGINYMNRNRTSVILRGAGCSLATGLIYRPTQWLRLGFGLQTPSVSSLYISTSGTLDARTDSLRWSDAPSLRTRMSDFHMPLHTSASVAFQITHYALIALQYDYFKQPGEMAHHSLRTGVEVVPYPGVYINAGYAYESPFKNSYPAVAIDKTLDRQDTYFLYTPRTQFISGAVGYRGRWFLIQAAYQYRMQRVNLYAHENSADPYRFNTHTHRVVVTSGWHR